MREIYAKKVLTPPQLEAIGCVAVESANVEAFIELGIFYLSGVEEPTGRLLIGNAMLSSKVDLLADFIKRTIGEESYKEKFSKLLADLRHEISNRNTIIHGYWQSVTEVKFLLSEKGPFSGEQITQAIKPMRDGTARKFNIEQAMGVAEKLSEHGQKLLELLIPIISTIVSKRHKNASA